MNISLTKEDIISMIKGTHFYPTEKTKENHPFILQLGWRSEGRFTAWWSWNTPKLEELPEKELLGLYSLIKGGQ